MPPLKPKACVPVPAPYRAFFHRSAASAGNGLAHVPLLDVQATDIVQAAVVGLAHDGVDGNHLLIAGLRERVFHDGFAGTPDAEGIGEHDGRFDDAEFVDLGGAGELAEAVADIDGGGRLLLKEIAFVREDGGDAGVDAGGIVVDGYLAYAHAGDVGDGVVLARRQDAGLQANFTGARASLGGHQGGAEQCSREATRSAKRHTR